MEGSVGGVGGPPSRDAYPPTPLVLSNHETPLDWLAISRPWRILKPQNLVNVVQAGLELTIFLSLLGTGIAGVSCHAQLPFLSTPSNCLLCLPCVTIGVPVLQLFPPGGRQRLLTLQNSVTWKIVAGPSSAL